MRPGMTMQEALACCKIYVSESRNQKALAAIAEAAAAHSQHAPLINTFPDPHYNRVGYTLAGVLPSRPDQKSYLQAAVLDMVAAALSHIDLQQHAGSHPRLGAVDHICFHPLVPSFVYGAAHPDYRPLDAIRRALGYFSPNIEGQWAGYTVSQQSDLVADFLPKVANYRSGVVVVGACPWITNYNIPILSNNLELGRKIAKKVSSRGGGLPAVQAMALLHGKDMMEIACNLTDLNLSTPVTVQEEVKRLADLEGLSTLCGYCTDLSEGQVTETSYHKLNASLAL